MAEPRQNVAALPADRLRQLMARLRQKDQAAAPGIKPVERDGGPLPLSPSQESFWLLGRFAPESAVAHLPVALRLSGPLDRPALLRSFAAVAQRHEPLRTAFGERGGLPFQTPLREVAVELPAADLAGLPAARREPEMLRRATAEARRPFDLARAPLFRLLLLRLGAAEHVLVVTLHHLVADGWSLGVLLREIGALYGAFADGKSPALPALPVQHLDYVDWQRRQLQGEALRAELEFWRARLDGLGALALAADRPRPPLPSFRGHQLEMALDAGQTAAADELAHRQGGTLFMVLLAAFQILLARYGGQTGFGVGTPVANRERTEVEGLIGLFVNTLVLRADLAGDPAGTELLRRVREDLLAVYPHGALPFETLAEELKPEREPGQNPFFQTLLALQNHPLAAMRIGALGMAPFELDTAAAKLDVSIAWRHQGERLTGSLEVNADIFEPAFAERLRRHYGELLRALAATPERRLSELSMLSADERRQLVTAWNGTPATPATPRCLHHLFAAQAARAPEAVALVAAGGERLTYGELDRRSDRLARRLAALGAGPEVPVGVHLEPSTGLVIALLALWKAGGAYLPLDPALPAERLAFMLADSGAQVVITAGAPAAVLTASGARLCRLDAPGEDGAPEAEPVAAVPANLAWILYTSGSTGRPKAVGVAHAAAAVHLATVVDTWALSADDRVLQFDAPSFDVWLEETLAPLLCGASLALRGAELWEPTELLPRAAALGVSVLPLPTAYWRQWVGTVGMGKMDAPPPAGPPLRLAVVGGEAMTADAARAWWRSPLAGIRLLNGYGPTEAVISATFHEVGRGEAERTAVGLGLPLAGRCAFVLDPAGDLLPAGVPGELCLGGRPLARGYAGSPALTAERFVPDPFAGEWGEAGGRLYRTGDRARRRPDGVLEFLGRLDQQVKIRGFRVELGEIEAALAAHPRVREAAVIARQEETGNPLTAFVVTGVSDDGGSAAELGDELRRHLARRLPAHMIPPGVTVLPALPLTPAGKVDRRALAGLAPADRRAAAGAYAPPRDPIEELLAPLWAEVLGVERVGVHDDFFTLGGHSLLGMQLTSRVADLFGVKLTVRALFEARTVGGLAERIAEELAADAGGILAEMLAERDGTGTETQEGRRESSHG